MSDPSNRSTKQLSSFFSSCQNDSTSTISRSNSLSQRHEVSRETRSRCQTPSSPRQSSANYGQLNLSPSPTRKPLETNLEPQNPPPLVTATGSTCPQSRGSPQLRPSSDVWSPPSSREGSRSRPQTPAGSPQFTTSRSGTPDSARMSKKKSWLPGKLSKSDVEIVEGEPKAWIAGLQEHVSYDLKPLLQGGKVSAR